METNKARPQAAFTVFDPKTKEGREIASRASVGLTETYQAVARSTFRNFEPNISVKDGFSRYDYEYFRPDEMIPKDKKNILVYCMEAYRKVGLVRNVIDLMGDFTVQGIKIVHSNKQRQKFLRKWAKMVKFRETSERFANMLFRAGNVVIRRTTAKLPAAEEDRMIAQGERLEPDTTFPEPLTTAKRNIPIRYNFLNPASLEIVGGELAQFTGKQVIAIRITSALKRSINSPKPEEVPLVALLPDFLVQAVKQGRNIIPLEQEKLIVSHYKKDDWQAWADPMTYAVLDDLILLEKMKLADLAALDGAISQVRIWKLGDLEKGIMPTDAAIEKLSDILLSNPGGGAFDLIWGPDLTFQEYKTDVHQFLGGDKYEPVLRSLYAGLGVPPTLTGTEGASGATNNFVSLQTLIQRLEYVRNKLIEFWENELNLLQQALGFQEPARLQFDEMTLTDETAQKKLLLDLWDRNLVSDEAVIETFKEFPDIELLRQRRENRERARKLRPEKAGPFFSSEKTREYIKTALGRGYINPQDLDLGIEHTGETPFNEQLRSVKEAKAIAPGGSLPKAKGAAGQGRPKNSKDSGTRSDRSFKVRTSAEQIETFSDFMIKNIWAKESYREISEHVNPLMLKYFSKANLRELSVEETNQLEKVKFAILANLEPYSAISEQTVLDLIENRCTLPSIFKTLYDKLSARAYDIHSREPNIEERKLIQASVYALLK